MGYNTANVHRLESFVQAKSYYQKVKPIRGRATDVRPLGDRRHDGMASIEMSEQGTVDLLFYNKRFVSWSEDDTFTVSCPTYYSAYAPDNCKFFLPGYMTMRWKDCRMFLVHDSKEYLMQPGDVFRFAKTGGKYFFLNKPVAYNYRKTKGALAKVMDKYAPFLDWLQVVSSVTNIVDRDKEEYVKERFYSEAGVVTRGQVAAEQDKRQKANKQYDYSLSELSNRIHYAPYSGYRNSGFSTPHCRVLDRWLTSENPEDWVVAMEFLAVKYGGYRYTTSHHILHFDKAVTAIENIASHLYRDTVFERVRLPDGKRPSRTNEKFFNSYEIPTLAELSTYGRSVR
jgi:hypothetical protein